MAMGQDMPIHFLANDDPVPPELKHRQLRNYEGVEVTVSWKISYKFPLCGWQWDRGQW